MNIKKSFICCFVTSVLMCFPAITVFSDPTSSLTQSNSQPSSYSSTSSSSSNSSTSSKPSSESSISSSSSKTYSSSNVSSSSAVSSASSSTTQVPSLQATLPPANVTAIESSSDPVSKPQKSTAKKPKASSNPSSSDSPKPFLWTESSSFPESSASQNVSEQAAESRVDLPDVDSSEIVLPEVIASNSNNNRDSFVSGIIAWLCIAIGVAIVLFVIFNGKRKGEISLNTTTYKNKKNSKKSKRLLSNKYYKNRY